MARQYTPIPCQSQCESMEALGFKFSREQPHGDGVDWLGHRLKVNLRESEELTLPQATAFIITAAMNHGARETANGIKKFLRIAR